MTSVIQPSYFTDLLGTVWPTGPAVQVEEKSLADTLAIPVNEGGFPRRLSDDQTKADRIVLDMLANNVPQSIIRSILRSDSYDILVPPNPSTAPYIVVSYADDTQKADPGFVSNASFTQEPAFLMVPPPGVTAADRDEDDDEELDLPPYTLIDLESEDLEPFSDLRKFFAGCDLHHNYCPTAAPTLDLNLGNIDPDSSRTTRSQASSIIHKSEPGAEKWGEVFAWNADRELETGEGTDSSLELYGSDTESDITQFSNSL